MTKWLKSRTVWLGVIVGVLGVVQSTIETAPLPEPWGGIGLTVLGAVIVGLRGLTVGPVGGGK